MRSNRLWLARLLFATTIGCFASTLVVPAYVILAQEDDKAVVEARLFFDHSTLTTGESGAAILNLYNTMPYTLTNVAARLQGSTFDLVDSTSLPNTLPPYTNAQVEYTLKSQTAGSQNLIFTVQYSWYNPDSGITHQGLETVFVEKIEVRPWLSFDWPDYLIPLIIGLIMGQLVAVWNDRRKQGQERQQQEEQARGITLAVLQAARKGVEAREEVSFSLWDEAIVKGNLYPALHRLGRTIGKPELSKRLAELSIILADYNERQSGGNLTEDITTVLVKELTDLIQMVENRS